MQKKTRIPHTYEKWKQEKIKAGQFHAKIHILSRLASVRLLWPLWAHSFIGQQAGGGGGKSWPLE